MQRVLAVAVVLVACSSHSTEKRAWQANDHAQTASQSDQRTRGAGADHAVDTHSDEFKRAVTAVWLQLCAGCHGEHGGGDGPDAAGLSAKLVDMRSPAWQEAQSDQALLQVIAKGRGAMPAFEAQIRPEGMTALVGYIRAFRK